MSKENRIRCPYSASEYEEFHHICPFNGEEECVQYMLIDSCLGDVDAAYGEYQRNAYERPKPQNRIHCPYNQPKYDDFHDICPKNGSVECENYQLLERHLKEVDRAYGEYQRNKK